MVTNQPSMKQAAERCKMRGQGYCPRPLESAAAFLSKKWTLSVLVTLGNFKTLRFNHLLDRVEGISPKTLTHRLKELEKQGLILRQAFRERPPRVQYTLSPRGRTLYRVIIPLMRWAER